MNLAIWKRLMALWPDTDRPATVVCGACARMMDCCQLLTVAVFVWTFHVTPMDNNNTPLLVIRVIGRWWNIVILM